MKNVLTLLAIAISMVCKAEMGLDGSAGVMPRKKNPPLGKDLGLKHIWNVDDCCQWRSRRCVGLLFADDFWLGQFV